MSGAPDFSGATAADVNALFKARGNPAYSEAIDPSEIGAALQVTVSAHFCVLKAPVF